MAEFAWGYFNLGCAQFKMGKKKEAIENYTAALERDPSFLLAYWNRALAYQELEQYQQALADFDKTAELGHDNAFLHAYRGTALERLGRPKEADAAFRTACLRALTAPPQVQRGIRWCYGFAVANRLPEEAREAFDDVIRQDPKQHQALYGRAMLAVDEGQLEEAVGYFNRAIEASPNFDEARRFCAIMHARRGKFDEASRDINWCLERHSRDGATLYCAACVYARAVEHFPEQLQPKLKTDAIALLREAFALGYGRDKAAADPDLASIRTDPEFKKLLMVNDASQKRSYG